MESILDIVSQYIEQGNILVFVLVYLAGILASFTPCVYPVIPLTVAYFSAQGEKKKRETFFLAFVYVVGMSVIYSILGMIAALTGTLFGRIAVHPITLFIFANICVLFGLYMLDVFDVSLPEFLTTRKGSQQRRGVVGSFLLGASAGLVVGPCTTPVLAVLLAYVGTKQGMLFGASLLFVFSFGMGTLLMVLAMFSGLVNRLPKSGKWMIRIKKIAGLIMIALGEYFLIKMGKMLF